MSEESVGQRLKFLIGQLNLDVRSFCKALDVSETTVRNYFNRGSNPNAEFLMKVASTFELVNLSWLLTGKGELFTGDSSVSNTSATRIKKVSGGAVHSGNGNQTNNYNLSDCEKDRDAFRAERDSLAKQVELLHGQLQTKDALIASKEETIDLLKAAFNRPN